MLLLTDCGFIVPNACRSVSQRSLEVPTLRQSVDEQATSASTAEQSEGSRASTPLTHPSSSGPAASELEAYQRQLSSLPAELEAAGLVPEWARASSLLGQEYPKHHRESLPKPKQKLPALNIFSIIKDWVGEPPTHTFCCM